MACHQNFYPDSIAYLVSLNILFYRVLRKKSKMFKMLKHTKSIAKSHTVYLNDTLSLLQHLICVIYFCIVCTKKNYNIRVTYLIFSYDVKI